MTILFALPICAAGFIGAVYVGDLTATYVAVIGFFLIFLLSGIESTLTRLLMQRANRTSASGMLGGER